MQGKEESIMGAGRKGFVLQGIRSLTWQARLWGPAFNGGGSYGGKEVARGTPLEPGRKKKRSRSEKENILKGSYDGARGAATPFGKRNRVR